MIFPTTVALAATYQQPPPDVAAVLDAHRPPSLRLSPDQSWMLLLDRPALPPISEIAAPIVKVAGVRLDPRTHGPARENPYTAATLRRTEDPRATPVPIRVDGAIREAFYDEESRRVAMTVTTDEGIALWVAELGPNPTARRLTPPRLMAAMGDACEWLPGDQGLVCRMVPEKLGLPPAEDPVPTGPRIQESLGRKAPARTYADLLQSEHDERSMEYWLQSELVRVSLDGTLTPLAPAAIWRWTWASPDGSWLLTSKVHEPWSWQVPISEFPTTLTAVELATGREVVVSELPLADEVPIAFGSVRTGRRRVGWRADAPATLYLVSALDGGDARVETAERDALDLWTAPFAGEPTRWFTSDLRVGSVWWGDAHLALVEEEWWATRRTRTTRLDPSDPAAPRTVIWDRSSQDEYGDPGSPMTRPGPYGEDVLRRTPTGGLWLYGQGVSAEGVHPFLDRFEWTSTRRVWQAEDPYHESIVEMLDDDARRLLTWRQSQTDVPNLWLRQGRRTRPLTSFPDWAPVFADVRKEVIRYDRDDGLPLSATVYLPPGFVPGKDPPRPAIFVVYPSEFKHRSDAGQVTAAENTFSRPGGSSYLFFLMHGWVVVDDPQLPIVAEGEEQPNDTYVSQLVKGAEAAVRATTARGLVDAGRLVVSGHSYGAFTTANLLAHTDLFRSGIARSGAYNRTLTPFGFQGEDRVFWEATDTYVEMSPFSVADRVDEPLLLIHGADDSNAGTWPMQSERFYAALKGLGATVRYVELPAEDHGYQARESVGHVLWEMFRWADQTTEAAKPAPVP